MSNPNIARDSSTTFKPGQSGNPKGRARREWTWSGLLEEAMEEQDETGTPYKKIIAKKIRQLAKAGDMIAAKEIMNRMDGMPMQKNEVDNKHRFELTDEQLKRIIG